MLYYNTSLKKFSRDLRKNMTGAEQLLWSKLRRKQLNGYQVYRQRILGDYIADFYCPSAKLVIEVDGSQHYSDEGKEKDQRRDKYMEKQGLRVLRFSDQEVFANLDRVVELIYENL